MYSLSCYFQNSLFISDIEWQLLTVSHSTSMSFCLFIFTCLPLFTLLQTSQLWFNIFLQLRRRPFDSSGQCWFPQYSYESHSTTYFPVIYSFSHAHCQGASPPPILPPSASNWPATSMSLGRGRKTETRGITIAISKRDSSEVMMEPGLQNCATAALCLLWLIKKIIILPWKASTAAFFSATIASCNFLKLF